MTDLPRFLLDLACCVLFVVSYVRKYSKLRRRSRLGHRMAAAVAAAAATTPPSAGAAAASSPGLDNLWNKRASTEQFPVYPAPVAKRSKDGEVPAAAVPMPCSGGQAGLNDSIGIERECAGNSESAAADIQKTETMDSRPSAGVGGPKKGTPAIVLTRRPSMILIPEASAARREFEKEAAAMKLREEQEVAARSCTITEGEGYCVASRKGRRQEAMEDGHAVMTRIDGDPKHAYFGVFDGHGGRAAVDFVGRSLGTNVVAALRSAEETPVDAIRSAYVATDRDFVSQKLRGGACVATVVLKDGMLHAANAGDCRVVLSRGGVARALTVDHRGGREDERVRIENTGGFVSCYGGGAGWRVQGTLSVTRSIGDTQLKQWIIPDPDVTELRLLQGDYDRDDFLILASDGLWDHVGNQEAVDIILANGGCGVRAARALADAPFARGGRDDVTVMLVLLRGFVM